MFRDLLYATIVVWLFTVYSVTLTFSHPSGDSSSSSTSSEGPETTTTELPFHTGKGPVFPHPRIFFTIMPHWWQYWPYIFPASMLVVMTVMIVVVGFLTAKDYLEKRGIIGNYDPQNSYNLPLHRLRAAHQAANAGTGPPPNASQPAAPLVPPRRGDEVVDPSAPLAPRHSDADDDHEDDAHPMNPKTPRGGDAYSPKTKNLRSASRSRTGPKTIIIKGITPPPSTSQPADAPGSSNVHQDQDQPSTSRQDQPGTSRQAQPNTSRQENAAPVTHQQDTRAEGSNLRSRSRSRNRVTPLNAASGSTATPVGQIRTRSRARQTQQRNPPTDSAVQRPHTSKTPQKKKKTVPRAGSVKHRQSRSEDKQD